jgi:hypothetical protein
MTLLIAGADGDEAWMISDTAMTDPKLTLRDRVSEPKIFRLTSHSLVGYAGDSTLAHRVIVAAAIAPAGEAALDIMVQAQRSLAQRENGKWVYPELDLAYSFYDGEKARLFRV